MKTNFARLNHILIPTRKDDRDRFRRTRTGKALRPIFMLFSRLSREGRTMAVVTFIAGGFSVDIARTESYMLFATLLGLIGGSLLWSRAFSLRGVHVAVVAPRLVTKNEAGRFMLEIRNDGEATWQALRVEGPFLPWDGGWIGPSPGVASLAAGERARVEMVARFSQRGEHHLDAFTIAALVPMGLAQGPAVETASCKFVVVPKAAKVSEIRAPRSRSSDPTGSPRAVRSGGSMDVHGTRPYRPGDMVRDLHAKSWARSGYPVVREYQQQEAIRRALIVDATGCDGDLLESILSLAAGAVAKMATTGETLTRFILLGGVFAPVDIGRGAAPVDIAMEALGRVEATPTESVEQATAKIVRTLDMVSSSILIEPAARGAAIATSLRTRGVEVSSVLVFDGDSESPPAVGDPHALLLDSRSILQGEPLTL